MPLKLRGPVPVLVASMRLRGWRTRRRPRAADARDVARAYLAANAAEVRGDERRLRRSDVHERLRDQGPRGHAREHQPALPRHGGVRRSDHGQRRRGRQGRLRRRRGREPGQGRVGRAGPRRAVGGRRRPRSGSSSTRREAARAAPHRQQVADDRRSPAAASRTRRSRPTLGWQPTASGLRLAWRHADRRRVATRICGTPPSTPRPARCSRRKTGPRTTTLDELKGQLHARQRRQLAPAFQPFEFAASARPSRCSTARPTACSRGRTRARNDAGRTLVSNPADSMASPYGWHDINGSVGAGVHDHAGQQRPRLPRPGRQQRAGLRLEPERRLEAALRLPDGPHAARAGLPRRRGREPVLRQQHDPRRPAAATGSMTPRATSRPTTTAAAAPATTPCAPRPQDGNGTNNANFSTPAADGGAPRMQMYLWPGNQLGAPEPARDRHDRATAPRGRASARRCRNAGLPGRTLIYGGTGCSEADYPASRPASNWIAVVDGGTTACTYLLRTEIAQSLNADAVVVAHNAAGNTPPVADRPDDRRAGRDPGRRRQPGRRHRDQGADRRRPGTDRQPAQEPGAPRHPRR